MLKVINRNGSEFAIRKDWSEFRISGGRILKGLELRRAMNSPCFLSRISALLFLTLCLFGCANQASTPQNYPVVDRPEFMDQVLSQSELEGASAKWVSDLTFELRSASGHLDGEMNLEQWLERQRIEIEDDMRDYEGGTLYNLEFNLRLAQRMIKKLRPEK